jgi:hypothetical protein
MHKDPNELIAIAASVDEKLGIDFNATIPKLINADVWKEMVQVARGSFSVDCIVAPPRVYGYASDKTVKFTRVRDTNAMLDPASQVILKDAVLNVAMVWKHIWTKFKGARAKQELRQGSAPSPPGRAPPSRFQPRQ